MSKISPVMVEEILSPWQHGQTFILKVGILHIYMIVHIFLVHFLIMGAITFYYTLLKISIKHKHQQNIITEQNQQRPNRWCGIFNMPLLLGIISPDNAVSSGNIYARRCIKDYFFYFLSWYSSILFHFQSKSTSITAITERRNRQLIKTISSYHIMFWSIVSPYIYKAPSPLHLPKRAADRKISSCFSYKFWLYYKLFNQNRSFWEDGIFLHPRLFLCFFLFW